MKKKGKKGKEGTVIDMDASLPTQVKPGRPKLSGLPTLKERTRNEPAAAARRLGRPTHEDNQPVLLPFQATLAYSLRNSGGREPAIEYARLAARLDERFQRFIHAYDGLSVFDRGKVRLEDLCEAAELSPSDFLGGIVAVAHRYNMDVGNYMAALSHPDIVAATIESAKSPFGVEDRKMLHQHHNFLPASKGVQIQNNVTANANSTSQAAAIPPSSMPTFETDIISVAQVVRGDASQRKISAPRALPAPDAILEAEEVENEQSVE